MRTSSLLCSAPSSIGRVTLAAALGACAWFSVSEAQAHITLIEPPSWVVENASGDPQKTGPCGGSAVTPTNVVTEFEAGETITVQWRETVAHPGHFRISLAENRTDLVDPPVQTAPGSSTSVSATIMDPPVAPVLLDGLYPRDSVPSAGTVFTQEVTLPDTPCEKCTLQVIQFMAAHGPGYFYHHCADIKILAAGSVSEGGGDEGGAAGSASTGAAAGSGGTAGPGNAGSQSAGSQSAGSGSDPVSSDDDDDSGCSIANAAPAQVDRSAAPVALLGLGAELWRRRSKR